MKNKSEAEDPDAQVLNVFKKLSIAKNIVIIKKKDEKKAHAASMTDLPYRVSDFPKSENLKMEIENPILDLKLLN